MSPPTVCIVQGETVIDSLSVSNRGLAYGDGVFETMRIHGGQIPLLAWHWARLEHALGRLHIPVPGTAVRNLIQVQSAGIGQGVLKLIVTRGEGGRGYLPAPAEPVSIVSLHPLPTYERDFARDGIEVGVCPLRLGKSPLLAGLKHLNRLEQVLVRQSLHDAGFVEGVVLDTDDLVVEGAFSNICVISGQRMWTPALETAGVAGVMRAWLLEKAPQLGLSCHVGPLRLADVISADEVFLCNSVNGLWPVIAIDGHRFEIGPWTRVLQRALSEVF